MNEIENNDTKREVYQRSKVVLVRTNKIGKRIARLIKKKGRLI